MKRVSINQNTFQDPSMTVLLISCIKISHPAYLAYMTQGLFSYHVDNNL